MAAGLARAGYHTLWCRVAPPLTEWASPRNVPAPAIRRAVERLATPSREGLSPSLLAAGLLAHIGFVSSFWVASNTVFASTALSIVIPEFLEDPV